MNERKNLPFHASIRFRLLAILLGIGISSSLVIALVTVLGAREKGNAASEISAQALESQVEEYLMQITLSAANENDLIFAQLRSSIFQLANYAAWVFENPEIFTVPDTWRFSEQTSSGPDGQYLNGEEDITSVFVPAVELEQENMIRDVEISTYLEVPMQSLHESSDHIEAVYFASPHEVIRYYPNINLGKLLPADYRVTQQEWYTSSVSGLNEQSPTLWSPVYQDAAGLLTTTTSPILNGSGDLLGVVGLNVDANELAAKIESMQVHDTGYAFLIDQTGLTISLPKQGYQDILGRAASFEAASVNLQDISTPFAGVISRMLQGEEGFQKVELTDEELYVAYAPLKNTGWSLGVVTRESEALAAAMALDTQLDRSTRELITERVLPALAIISFLVVLAGLLATRHLVSPIWKLVDAASQLGEGHLDAAIPETRNDEIGLLGSSLAGMTKSLRLQVDELMANVENRARDLNRKKTQLEAASQVAHAAASIRDLDQLLERVAQLIAGKLKAYHVGIYFLDEAREYAVLRAASSDIGRQMVKRGYRLKVGEVGIVGYVAGRTKPRIAFNIGEDAAYFSNSDLPLTRSEIAIPFKSQERVIGVLDVHSEEAAAFSSDDIETLQVIADQVALAVESARLLTETRQSIEEINRSYTKQSQLAWSERLQGQPAGYSYTALGVAPASQAVISGPLPQAGVSQDEDGSNLTVPIIVHGQVLGGIRLHRVKGEPGWTEEELHVVEQAILQIGPALENARLLEEAQSRASREKTVNVITTQVRNAAGVQAILQNTVLELGKALGVSRTFIQFGVEPTSEVMEDS